jgi:hypothetical protein
MIVVIAYGYKSYAFDAFKQTTDVQIEKPILTDLKQFSQIEKPSESTFFELLEINGQN